MNFYFNVEVEMVQIGHVPDARDRGVELIDPCLYEGLGRLSEYVEGEFRVSDWKVNHVPPAPRNNPPFSVRLFARQDRDFHTTPDAEGLDACDEIIARIEAAKDRAVVAMRMASPPVTWDEIARITGMSSKQAASFKWTPMVQAAKG